MAEVNGEMNDSWGIARNIEKIIKCEKMRNTLDPVVFNKLLDQSFLKFHLSDSISNYITLVNDVV